MSKIRGAVAWSALDVMFRSGFGFIVTVILARILMPEDFGIIAMLAIFMSLASLFVDGGFTQAIIQSQLVTHEDESSIFFFNLVMGAVFAIILCILAPWIASFYGQPILKNITMVLALNLFIGAFGSVHNALLSKKLDFKKIAKVGGIATLFSGMIALIAAWTGMGVWSLVIQSLSVTLLTSVFFWRVHAWRPLWFFSWHSIRKHFGFSGYLMISSFMNRVYGNIYGMVIGKAYSAQDAGYYTQAYTLQQLPITILTRVLSRVAFPVFSASNEDRDKLIRVFSKTLAATIFISVPVSVLMMLLSEAIVLFLFGDKWLPAAPVLQVLSLTAMLIPLQMINISLLKALGRTDLNVRVMIIKFITGLTMLFLASSYGLVAIAWAFVLANIVNTFANTFYINKLLDYGLVKQLRIVLPYVFASIPMVIVVEVFRNMVGLQGNMLLLISMPIAAMTYLVMCKIFQLEAIDYLLTMFKKNRGEA